MLTCPRESELKALIDGGQWPAATDPDLRAHVEGCRSCREFLLVTQAFQRARTSSIAAARPVSPGVLWWRAQLRRRNAAVERIGKPILGAQIFALTITLVLSTVAIVSQARDGIGWLTWLEQLPQSSPILFDAQWLSALWPADPTGSGLAPLLLISALAVLALLGGVVIYFASEKR